MYKCLAAVDIGSNTVHLIVAATDGQQLTVLADDSIFVRLADGVWNLGYIPDERILATTQAMLHLRDIARGFGVEHVAVVATEVARSARNTPALLSAVLATTGLQPLVLSGMDEAMLTFRGVTHGRQLPASVAVADLGGGSLEVIIAELGHGAWRTSLPIGSAFMHDRFVTHDPPHATEIHAIQSYLTEALAAIPQLSHVEEVLVCGGTVNALMRLVQQAQGRAMGDRVLRRRDLDHARDIMLAQPAALVAADYHLRVERARLLPTGAVILGALLDHLRLPGILVSQAGIREGVILANAVYGEDWLEGSRADTYPIRAQNGHSRPVPVPGMDSVAIAAEGMADVSSLPVVAMQPTGTVAWEMMRDQCATMLQQGKAALQGDVEAVHDMRVASRRLRTMLDTFAPCFTAVATRKLRRALKRLAHALGGVRDADVALETLEAQLVEADPALIPALKLLIKRHKATRREARRALKLHLGKGDIDQLQAYMQDLRLAADHVISPLVVRQQAMTVPTPIEEGMR